MCMKLPDETGPAVSVCYVKNDEWALQHLRYEACFSTHQKMKLSLSPGTLYD